MSRKYLSLHWKRILLIAIVLTTGILIIRKVTKIPEGIETTLVKKDNIQSTFSANGTVKAKKMADLKFYSPGKITWIGVKKGDKVRKYQGLASLDQIALNALYQQSLNNLRETNALVDSTHDALKGKSETETFAEKYTRTVSEVTNDNAFDSVKIAKNALDHAVLVTPIAGEVVETNNLMAGINLTGADLESKFIRVVDFDSLYFEVNIDEGDFGKVKIDQTVKITLDAYPDNQCEGKVTEIGKDGKRSIGGVITFPAEIKFSNCNNNLGLSLNGQANFITSTTENILLIPKKYLVQKNGKNHVWKQTGDSIRNKKLVEVEVGISSTNDIEIKNGLNQNDIIVFII